LVRLLWRHRSQPCEHDTPFADRLRYGFQTNYLGVAVHSTTAVFRPPQGSDLSRLIRDITSEEQASPVAANRPLP
jgi:hypothetical protein